MLKLGSVLILATFAAGPALSGELNSKARRTPVDEGLCRELAPGLTKSSGVFVELVGVPRVTS